MSARWRDPLHIGHSALVTDDSEDVASSDAMTTARTVCRFAVVVALSCLLLTGCSESAPIGALLSTDGSVSILARPCPGKGIGKLIVLEHGQAIYTAVLDQGTGVDSLPLVLSPLGYSVTGRFPSAHDATGRTFVARITANDGVNLGSFEFNYDALHPDMVTYGHTKYETVEKFRERKGTDCP